MPMYEGYLRESVAGRLITASTGVIAYTEHGLARLADGTLRISTGAVDHMANGFPVSANGSLCVTTQSVPAGNYNGFRRQSPQGPLIATMVLSKMETGYPRGPGFELAMTAVT